MQDAQLDPRTAKTIEAIHRMNEALARRDVDAIMATLTDDIVWETTSPPDGERYAGRAAVRAAVEGFLGGSREVTFETEELVALGDRAFFTWTYRWVDRDGKPGHRRGVDVLRVRDGKVAEMLAYVKG